MDDMFNGDKTMWFEIGYKGKRQMTFQKFYEDAVAVANRIWGGCDYLSCKD